MRKEYNANDLRDTIDKIDRLAFKAKMELNEVEEERKKLNEFEQARQTKLSDTILTGAEHLEGRTIKRVVSMSERWDSKYLYFECEDGQRVCIRGEMYSNCKLPAWKPKKMEESGMFKDSEIQRRKDYIEGERKRREKDAKRRKEEELRRLQKELGE